MGQIVQPTLPDILLTAVDRLVARNADGGLSPAASHVILLGESAGRNLGARSNIILLGFEAGAGGISSAGADGTVVVGGQSLKSLSASGAAGPFTVLGFNNLTLLTQNTAASMQAIGDNIAPAIVGGAAMFDNTLIGEHVLGRLGLTSPNNAGATENVIIGNKAARGSNGGDLRGCSGSVVIGVDAASGTGVLGGGGLNDCVIIGRQAGLNMAPSAAATNNVVIGALAARFLSNGAQNVWVGAGDSGSNGAQTDNVGIGYQAGGGTITGNDNVLVGSLVTTQLAARNIVIGRNAASGVPAASSDVFVVGTFDAGATNRTLLYGDLANGNLIVGKSTQGTNRDMPGTNVLKIVNGTATGNPAGGGMFYATAGLLAWRDSAGVDYNLTPAGQLASRTVAFTNNAAAAAGTLNNAPVAGNPTKWIPINDNGTIRNIPAW